jgi:hypothetical protein
MWIASKIGFFSVVIDSKREGRMLIRARCRADIFNLYEGFRKNLVSIEPPTSDETRDYRWRLSISRTDWITLAAKLAEEVNYPNFKSEVHRQPDQENKSGPYMAVWSVMHGVQIHEGKETPDPSREK